MSIILDLIIVAIVLFFVITSAKRGFVKTVLDVVAFFLALYISVSFSGVLAEGIYNIFIKDMRICDGDLNVIQESEFFFFRHFMDFTISGYFSTFTDFRFTRT